MPLAQPANLSALLRSYRLARGLSQQALADRAGLSLNAINALERGARRHPYPETVQRLVDALDLSEEERASLGRAAHPRRLWHVPYRRNPSFTGREQVLEQMYRSQAASRQGVVIQALTGIGGIGKTQTALEYAFRFRQDYQAVLWLQAETREVLLGDLHSLAEVLDLPERGEQERDRLVKAARSWLEANSGWLLILDNVEDLRLVEPLLPGHGRGQVLLTTRDPATGTLAQGLPLEAWTTEEGVHFLVLRARLIPAGETIPARDTPARHQASTLVETLSGLPLALDQAGAFMEEVGCDPGGYLDLYRTHRGAMLGQRGRQVIDHPESVAVTWTLAFERIKQAHPPAAAVLRLCAFLHPDAIPEDLFTEGRTYWLPAELRSVAADPWHWNEVLEVLRRYALVERQVETKTLRLHRLMHIVLQEQIRREADERWVEHTVQLISRAFPRASPTTWQRCQQLLPHALECAEHIEVWGLRSDAAAAVLNKAGFYLRARAEATEALPLYKQARAMWEQTPEGGFPDVAHSWTSQAHLYQDEGRYDEALAIYEQAQELYERVLGPEHPDVATCLMNQANLLRVLGRYTESASRFEQAKTMYALVLGEDHPNVASTLHQMASLWRTQGEEEQAHRLDQQALGLLQQTYGSVPEIASHLHKLADRYQRNFQGEQARSLSELALAMVEHVLGPDHPDVAMSLNNLAKVYQHQGEYTQALSLFQQALSLRERAYGPHHLYTARSLNYLATLLHSQRQYAEALLRYKQALEIFERTLGKDHSHVAVCLEAMATLLSEMGQSSSGSVQPDDASSVG